MEKESKIYIKNLIYTTNKTMEYCRKTEHLKYKTEYKTEYKTG